MSYNILLPRLHSIADATQDYFKRQWGISKFQIEKPPLGLNYRPTLWANTRDFHLLIVEVSETAYKDAINSLILDCKNESLPVKLFVSIPEGLSGIDFRRHISQAKKSGVGVLQIDSNNNGTIILNALSLSLTGMRSIEFRLFPKKYCQDLWNAQQTFINGDPVKGCSNVFDIMEDLCRRIAIRAQARGYWKNGKKLTLAFNTCPWSNIMDTLLAHLDINVCKCTLLTKPLLNKVSGLVPDRNKAGHKIRSRKDLIDRDKRLRTSFENSTDILLELINATKPIKGIHR